MISITVHSLPPSSNHAYIDLPPRRKGKIMIPGGRALSPEGRKYKKETIAYIAQNYPNQLRHVRKDTPLFIYVRFYFPALMNKGWPKSAETRYKKVDVSNRLKLFEDCLKDAAGIDDSQNELILLHKLESPTPRTTVFIWDLEKEELPIEPLLRI